jgi:hypothetical protein
MTNEVRMTDDERSSPSRRSVADPAFSTQLAYRLLVAIILAANWGCDSAPAPDSAARVPRSNQSSDRASTKDANEVLDETLAKLNQPNREPLRGTFDVPPGIPASITEARFVETHRAVIERILEHALTSEENRSTVEAYSGGSKWVLLRSFGSPIEWPSDFGPTIAEYKFRRSLDEIPSDTVLGVDLREYGPVTNEDRDRLWYLGTEDNRWKVVLVIYNAKGGAIHGGQRTYYDFDPEAKNFRFLGSQD